jgi:uncharacterized protein
MRLVDANVLLYAVNTDSEHHDASRAWLDRALSGADRVGFAWVPLLAFVRLTTRPDIFPKPLTPSTAVEQVQAWIGARAGVLVNPTPRHGDVLARMIQEAGSGGNLVNDAHLAALAIEHQATIVSYDHDFGRFADVRWDRPDDLLRSRR